MLSKRNSLIYKSFTGDPKGYIIDDLREVFIQIKEDFAKIQLQELLFTEVCAMPTFRVEGRG